MYQNYTTTSVLLLVRLCRFRAHCDVQGVLAVQVGEEPSRGGAHQVPHHQHAHHRPKEPKGAVLEGDLPIVHLSVLQDKDANQKARKGPEGVPRVAGV